MGYNWKTKTFIEERKFVVLLFLISSILGLALTGHAEEAAMDGKETYKKHCAPCHGFEGKGDGPVAKAVFPKPRDLTSGSYKIRSTPSGSLPTDEDILHTLKNGMPGTSMIPWDILGDDVLKSLVETVKGFAPFFKDEKPDHPVKIADKTSSSPETIALGKKVYMDNGCWKCHGQEGRGDGPSSDRLKDDSGKPITPYDFTKGDNLKGGNTDVDIFLRFTTGMTGTPMPSYEDTIDAAKRWALVHYVRTLMRPAQK
ncbi:MAG: cytochrome c [Candidatus Magnetominusculus sp. LBB02]|nr:cytochrome c [Candidatus Magnetominusculus sp. LBB02]